MSTELLVTASWSCLWLSVVSVAARQDALALVAVALAMLGTRAVERREANGEGGEAR